MLKNWLKIYWYNTMKHKMYFLLTVVGLAIGIASVVLASLYYLEESSYDQWNPNKDEVYVVETKIAEDESWMLVPFGLGHKVQEASSDVIDYMYLRADYFIGMMKYKDRDIFYTEGTYVANNFFEYFPFDFVAGSQEALFDKDNAVVLLDTFAKEVFKEEDPIGKQFTEEGKLYEIVGVYTLEGKKSSVAPNVIFGVLDKVVEEEKENFGNYRAALLFKLREGVDIPKLEVLMQKLIIENLHEKLAQKEGITLEEYMSKEMEFLEEFRIHPLIGQHLNIDINLNAFPEPAVDVNRIYILIGLSATIFIISLFNYLNLSVSQLLLRNKEFGLSKMYGRSRNKFFLQGLFEGSIIAFIAVGIGLVLVEMILPYFRIYTESDIAIGLDYPEIYWIIAVAFALIIGLRGLLSLTFSSIKAIDFLKGKYKISRGKFGLRNVVLIGQFAIAFFFIVGALTINKQVNYMLDKDLGFRGDKALTVFTLFNNNKDKVDNYRLLKEQLLGVKGVEDITVSTLSMGGGGYNSSEVVYKDKFVQIMNVALDENFLEFFAIKLHEGRKLNLVNASDSISNVLLNRKTLQVLGETAMIGERIRWNNEFYTVVGIVDDYNTQGLESEVSPMIFFSLETIPWLGENFNEIVIKVDDANIEETLMEIEKVYKETNLSDFPFRYEFVNKRYQEFFKSSINERNAYMILSLVVIFIAFFGLFAVSSFVIGTKLKEVAIRKVLGAETTGLLRQLSLQYVLYCLIGCFAALFPSYYFLSKWLENYAYRIEIGWSIYVYSLLLILVLTIIVVLSRAYKATRVDVLKYIKYE